MDAQRRWQPIVIAVHCLLANPPYKVIRLTALKMQEPIELGRGLITPTVQNGAGQNKVIHAQTAR